MEKSFWLIIALACAGSICLFFYVADLCNNAEDNIKPSKLPEGIFDTENTIEKQHDLEEQQKNYDTWGIERIWEIGFGYNENATQDDIDHIGKLIHLKRLEISIGESEIDLSPLGNLVELESLDIFIQYGCSPDLSFVEKLSQLEKLDISVGSECDNSSDAMYGNTEREPFDLQSFANLKKLEWLDLAYVIIEDISPLAELKKIHEINLVDTNVRDISPLMSLDSLDKLYLFGNSSELVKEQAEALFHELKHMIVTEEIPYDYR